MADKTNLDITYINICQKNTNKTNIKKNIRNEQAQKMLSIAKDIKKNAIHSPTRNNHNIFYPATPLYICCPSHVKLFPLKYTALKLGLRLHFLIATE